MSGGTNFTDGTADTITLSLGQMTITGTVTITGNHANLSQGGGIFSYAAPVTIQNSIVAGNTDNGTAPEIRKATFGALTVTRSLIGRNSGTGLTATVGTTPDSNTSNVHGASHASIATPNPVMPIALAAPVSNLLHRR